MKKALIISLTIVLSSTWIALSAINFDVSPAWISEDSRCSTGGAVGDLNLDGYPDFAVSNGNDMAREVEVVYFGTSAGLSDSTGWFSTGSDYSAHCALGDIDKNGFPDLAVGNYIEASSGFTPSTTKVYFNMGGNLETSPSWVASDLNNTFRVTLADVDLDGDLDLACANGEDYTSQPQANEVYYNHDGTLEVSPGWISDDIDCSYDLQFADFDQDGDLDLAVANADAPTKIHINHDGSLETTASWIADETDNDNSLAWGDANNDGWLDLAVITNSQTGGSGLVKIFFNNNGIIETSPGYSQPISDNGFGSAVCWCDFDRDGDSDLAAGSWWGPVVIFENQEEGITQNPVWSSINSFVIEYLVPIYTSGGETQKCIDIDVKKSQSLFHLEDYPIAEIFSIQCDSQIVPPENYCVDPQNKWLSLAENVINGQRITICYRPAWIELLLATSWGDNNAKGRNYGYRNLSAIPSPTPTSFAPHTATPVPTMTPTPLPESRFISIVLNQQTYHPGNSFSCATLITNNAQSISVDFYFLLEIEGLFFFYPDFSSSMMKEIVYLDAYFTTTKPILSFSFPDPIGYSGSVQFFAALFYQDTYSLVCDYAASEIQIVDTEEGS